MKLQCMYVCTRVRWQVFFKIIRVVGFEGEEQCFKRVQFVKESANTACSNVMKKHATHMFKLRTILERVMNLSSTSEQVHCSSLQHGNSCSCFFIKNLQHHHKFFISPLNIFICAVQMMGSRQPSFFSMLCCWARLWAHQKSKHDEDDVYDLYFYSINL